jgi:hypothetical protein
MVERIASGRRSRSARLIDRTSGTWQSSSTDFLMLVRKLFLAAGEEASQTDGNCAHSTWAGIPMLFSALRCFMIEHAARANDQQILKIMTENNDLPKALKEVGTSKNILDEFYILHEIRNEIIHPAHLPSGINENTPEYFLDFKKRNLLQSTRRNDSDYSFLDQLASFKLFKWACRVCRDAGGRIIFHYSKSSFGSINTFDGIGFSDNFSRGRLRSSDDGASIRKTKTLEVEMGLIL